MRVDEHRAVRLLRLPEVRNHAPGQPKHLAGLLEARVLPKPREQLMEAGVERVTLRDLLCPPLVRPRYHPLLNRRAKGLGIGLADGTSMRFIGHPLEQAAAEDRIEFDA